jgi:hypothetical protein
MAMGYKTFKDSSTWCTISLSCSLSTSAKIYAGISTLSLRRHNDLSLPVELVLGSAKELSDGDWISLSIDGKLVADFNVNSSQLAPDRFSYIVTKPPIIQRFTEMMKKGHKAATTLIKVGEAPVASQFSLAGSVASMLYLDEYQRLLDTPYAFHAKGNKTPLPRHAITAITKPEQVPHDILAGWFDGEEKTCSFFDDDKMERLYFGDGFRLTLSSPSLPKGHIYSLPCGMGGAYNQPYILFFAPFDRAQPITEIPFVTAKGAGQGGPDEMPDAWNINWDFGSHSLESFFKGRGLGDCGSYSVWTLGPAQKGLQFTLRELRVKEDCDGNYDGGPQKWPRIK